MGLCLLMVKKMKINLIDKESSTLKKIYEITIPYSIVEDNIQKNILALSKTFSMPGFRIGKVPLSLVKQKLLAEERNKELIKQALTKINLDHDIEWIGLPDVNIKLYNETDG